MEDHVIQAQTEYWNQAFSTDKPTPVTQSHWLDVLIAQSPIHLAGNILEVGCGRGYDTLYLLNRGCRVTCLDLSWNALRQVARLSPALGLVNGALPAPLPFRSKTFIYVVAGLSLHYFRWQDTRMIVQEIRRVVQPGGVLIFRVNSTEDIAHGAGRGEEIEPNLFLYQGRYKRFFTESMCRELFDESWQLEVLMPWLETRSQSAKPTWMGMARRL